MSDSNSNLEYGESHETGEESPLPPPPPPRPESSMTSPTPGQYHQIQPSEISQDEENIWNMVSTIGAIFGGLFAPLVSLLIAGEKSSFVRAVAVANLNGQITFMIWFLAAFLLSFVLIGFILFPLIIVADFVFILMSAVAAHRREVFRWPLTFEIIK